MLYSLRGVSRSGTIAAAYLPSPFYLLSLFHSFTLSLCSLSLLFALFRSCSLSFTLIHSLSLLFTLIHSCSLLFALFRSCSLSFVLVRSLSLLFGLSFDLSLFLSPFSLTLFHSRSFTLFFTQFHPLFCATFS
jgi:hypothetical protein